MSLTTSPTPEDREWKDYWRDLEKDPNFRRQTRREKRRLRRAHHKQCRRRAKTILEQDGDCWEDWV